MKYAGLGVLLLAGNINLAQAIPYDVIGSFANPGFSDPTSLHYLFNNDQGNNVSLRAVAEFGWGINPRTWGSSRFQFDGASGNTVLPTGSSSLINLGTFRYTNLPTVRAGKTASVDLNLDLSIGGSVNPPGLNYAMEINNTPNTPGTDTSDSMQIVSMTNNSTFTFNGIDYELKLVGFGQGITGFEVAENDSDLRHLYARVDRVSAVPLPASIWLFSSALIALAGVSRRTRKKV